MEVSETGTPFIHAFLAMGLAEVLIELGEFGKATGYLDEAREMGVRGVPTCLIDGQDVVTGARDTDFWVDLIDEINAMHATKK